MRYINELKSGDMISDIYLCKTKQTLKTKAGKSYYSMMLQDKTGTVDAKVWELTPGIEYFEPMDFIKVEGQVTSFQGSLQLNLRRIRTWSLGRSQKGIVKLGRVGERPFIQHLIAFHNIRIPVILKGNRISGGHHGAFCNIRVIRHICLRCFLIRADL